MKRHIALRGLSADHHHGLAWARRLARAADGKADATATAAAFLVFAEQELMPHLCREEATLLPEYARWAGTEEPLIARALVDHLAIRERILALQRADIEGAPVPPILAALSGRLEAHIRFEERELFPAITRALPLERMAAVGVLLGSPSPRSDPKDLQPPRQEKR